MGDKKTNINDSDVGKIDISKVKIVPAKDPSGIRKKGNGKKDNNDSSLSSGKLTFLEPIPASFNFIEKQMRKNPKIAKAFINTRFSWALTSRTNDIPNSLYLTRVSDDKTILDCLLKQSEYFFSSEELERRVEDNPEILEIYLNNNVVPVYRDSTNSFILRKVRGKTLLEHYLTKHDFEFDQIGLGERMKEDKGVFSVVYNYFINKDEVYKSDVDIIIAMLGVIPKTLCLAFYKKHFKKLKELFGNFSLKNAVLESLDVDTIRYLIDIGEHDFLRNLSIEKQTLICDDGTLVFNLLLQNEVYVIGKNYVECTRPTILKMLIYSSSFVVLEKIIDAYGFDILLQQSNNRNTLLDSLLAGIDFRGTQLEKKVTEFAKHDVRFAHIYSNYTRYAPSLLNADYEVLNSKLDGENSTILQYVFDSLYLGLKSMGIQYCDYILSHKISSVVLLERFINNKTLFDILFENCREKFIRCIRDWGTYRILEMQTYLKLKGIDVKKEFGSDDIYFGINMSSKQIEDATKNLYDKYLVGELDNDQKRLIQELREVFLADGKSDIEIIDLACNAFRYSFFNNYKYAARDLRTLINIKLNNPEFVMVYDSESRFVLDEFQSFIGISNKYHLDDFNHELAHVIHWYSMRDAEPYGFSNSSFPIDEKQWRDFVNNYGNQIMQTMRELRESQIDFSDSEYTVEETNSYKKRFFMSLKKAEISGNYSKETIDYLRTHIAIEDEYRRKYREVAIQELSYLYMKNANAIFDIVDALNGGKVRDEGVSVDGVHISIGHGSKYYSQKQNVFVEIIAQYVTILKSAHRDELLKILEGIVGHKFIEMLDKFNEEMFVESKTVDAGVQRR